MSRTPNRPASKPLAPPYFGPAWYVAAAWLAAALLAQVTIVHHLAVRAAVPSVVLVVVVWYAVRAGPRRASIYGLAAGLCEDVLSAQTGAAWTISTTIVAALTSLLASGFFADSIPLVCAVTAAATLARMLLFWIVMAFEGYPAGFAALHAHAAIEQAVLNAIVMLIAILVARRFDSAAK